MENGKYIQPSISRTNAGGAESENLKSPVTLKMFILTHIYPYVHTYVDTHTIETSITLCPGNQKSGNLRSGKARVECSRINSIIAI